MSITDKQDDEIIYAVDTINNPQYIMRQAAEQWTRLNKDLDGLEDDEELLVTIGDRQYVLMPATPSLVKLHEETGYKQ